MINEPTDASRDFFSFPPFNARPAPGETGTFGEQIRLIDVAAELAAAQTEYEGRRVTMAEVWPEAYRLVTGRPYIPRPERGGRADG